jgi:radical SAM superfamily enzyme YgiQ (UPF0313 family)
MDRGLEELAGELIGQRDPGVIGISVSVPAQVAPAFFSARALRHAGFRGPIILGGNMVARLGQSMAQPWVFDWVDALVLWQGEIVIPEIVRQAAGRQWHNIPNLIWMDRGEIRENPARVLATEEFGLPDFSGMDLSGYWGTQFLTAIGSRGCYYGRCSFCSIPYGWGNHGFLGNWTPEQVVRQIEIGVEEYSIRRFNFIDEALHPGLFGRVADLLLERGIDVEIMGYARFDRSWLDPRFLEKVARAGLRKLKLGLELAPSDGRKLLNKGDTADSRDLLAALSDNAILAHLFCMFGYPGSDVEDAIRTVEFALQHQEKISTLDVISFQYSTHTKVPGIKIIDRPESSWSVEHRYVPDSDGVLSMEEVEDLVIEIQDYLWRLKPRWLHPIYRLCSAFSPQED